MLQRYASPVFGVTSRTWLMLWWHGSGLVLVGVMEVERSFGVV